MKTEKTGVYGLGILFNNIACYLRTFNPLAAGSIPARPTRKKKGFRQLAGNLFLWPRAAKSTKVYVLGLVAVFFVVVSSVPARAEYRFAQDWSWEDTAWQGAALTLKIIDWGQTRHIAKHPETFYEMNPLLPKYPSLSDVDTYFAVGAIIQTVITLALPPKAKAMGYDINPRRIWQGVQIGMSGACVAHNFGAGIRIDF